MGRDRYERKHRWTRPDHPESLFAHTSAAEVATRAETMVSLHHALNFADDERCDDPDCVPCAGRICEACVAKSPRQGCAACGESLDVFSIRVTRLPGTVRTYYHARCAPDHPSVKAELIRYHRLSPR